MYVVKKAEWQTAWERIYGSNRLIIVWLS